MDPREFKTEAEAMVSRLFASLLGVIRGRALDHKAYDRELLLLGSHARVAGHDEIASAVERLDEQYSEGEYTRAWAERGLVELGRIPAALVDDADAPEEWAFKSLQSVADA